MQAQPRNAGSYADPGIFCNRKRLERDRAMRPPDERVRAKSYSDRNVGARSDVGAGERTAVMLTYWREHQP